jgi:hypothetical protein
VISPDPILAHDAITARARLRATFVDEWNALRRTRDQRIELLRLLAASPSTISRSLYEQEVARIREALDIVELELREFARIAGS